MGKTIFTVESRGTKTIIEKDTEELTITEVLECVELLLLSMTFHPELIADGMREYGEDKLEQLKQE